VRFLVRVRNVEGKEAPSSIPSLKARLSALALPRYENFRVSGTAIEFDLYEASPERLKEDLLSVESVLGPILNARDLSTTGAPRTIEESVSLAISMYEEERFWEVHDELESQWRKLHHGVAEREVLHGLILLAAAYVHVQKGEEGVALSLIGRALTTLEGSGAERYHGIDLAKLEVMLKEMQSSGSVQLVDLPALEQ
jgi:hypothetical protein